MNAKKFFPFLNWQFTAENMRADLIAGITVALVLIPQSMAYASLAGLPEYFGLYAAFLPVMIAALWGSSKQLATGPVAVVSLLTASTLIPLVDGYDTMSMEQLAAIYAPLAIAMSMMVGIIQLTLGVFRLGMIVNFLSHPVVVGFTNAAALIIGLSQLDKIFGVDKSRSEIFLHDVWGVIQQIPDTHIATFLMGVLAFALMWGLKTYAPKIPGVLVAVVSTTMISYFIGFEEMGGAVVGSIPQGLPSLQMPHFNMSIISEMIMGALVISMVGFMEAISIAKAMAARTHDRIDPNQELIGQGLGNITGCLSQAYPTSGSFSRSAVNLNAGAKTGMSSVFTGIIVLITLLFLTPLLYHLPKSVLAAVIMMAVIGLINFKSVIHAWKINKHDGYAAVVTFLMTILLAPHLEEGLLIGVGLSLGLYLFRTMKPRVAILGRYKDGTLRDLAIHPDLPKDDRIIMMRYDGSLYFANVAYFEDAVLHAVSQSPKARYLVILCDAVIEMDASGEESLHKIIKHLKVTGVTVVLSGMKKPIIEVIQRSELNEFLIDNEQLFSTEGMALKHIYEVFKAEEDSDSQFVAPLEAPMDSRMADVIT